MIVHIVAVVLLGLAINNQNATNKVESFSDFKKAVVESAKDSKTANHGNYNQ